MSTGQHGSFRARVPFSITASWAASLPDEQRLAAAGPACCAGVSPGAAGPILRRAKRGFDLPLAEWICGCAGCRRAADREHRAKHGLNVWRRSARALAPRRG
jgi:hypothetical protein